MKISIIIKIPFDIQQIVIMYHATTMDEKNTERPDEDTLYIYEPPPGPFTRDIPEDFVPEWGIHVCYSFLY